MTGQTHQQPATRTKQHGAIRTPKQIIVMGTNGTGKTTLVKKLVLNELKKKDSHVLVVTPHDMEWDNLPDVHPKFRNRIEWYKGARRVIYFEGLLPIILEYFQNGLLVFDDCRTYFKASLDQELHALLISRRQHMIDIIAVGHGFTEVPPKMFTFATHFALFKTIDNIQSRKNVIQNFEQLKEAQLRINQKATENPHYYEIIPI
jgi:Cdc6-like AAA superfamily ATPase